MVKTIKLMALSLLFKDLFDKYNLVSSLFLVLFAFIFLKLIRFWFCVYSIRAVIKKYIVFKIDTNLSISVKQRIYFSNIKTNDMPKELISTQSKQYQHITKYT
jgi:hypothetical protein